MEWNGSEARKQLNVNYRGVVRLEIIDEEACSDSTQRDARTNTSYDSSKLQNCGTSKKRPVSTLNVLTTAGSKLIFQYFQFI